MAGTHNDASLRPLARPRQSFNLQTTLFPQYNSPCVWTHNDASLIPSRVRPNLSVEYEFAVDERHNNFGIQQSIFFNFHDILRKNGEVGILPLLN